MDNANTADESIDDLGQDREELKKIGQLLANVSQEFKGWQVKVAESHEQGAEVAAEFSSVEKQLSFLGVQTATRTLLSRITEVAFHYRIPNSQPGDAEIHLSHTGTFSRTGIKTVVKRGGPNAQAIADQLTADKTFNTAFFPLDSKHFHLIQDEQGWLVKTGQMGAAWLAIKFPPTRKYIPMGADQTETLISCFMTLNKVLS